MQPPERFSAWTGDPTPAPPLDRVVDTFAVSTFAVVPNRLEFDESARAESSHPTAPPHDRTTSRDDSERAEQPTETIQNAHTTRPRRFRTFPPGIGTGDDVALAGRTERHSVYRPPAGTRSRALAGAVGTDAVRSHASRATLLPSNNACMSQQFSTTS